MHSPHPSLYYSEIHYRQVSTITIYFLFNIEIEIVSGVILIEMTVVTFVEIIFFRIIVSCTYSWMSVFTNLKQVPYVCSTDSFLPTCYSFHTSQFTRTFDRWLWV